MSYERVTVERDMAAPVDVVWRQVQDIERFPEYSSAVRSVVVRSRQGEIRDSDWEVYLRGSVLQWSERAVISDEQMSMTFEQTDGDLSHLAGGWTVSRTLPVRVSLSVEFEIGIPLLARMLTPIAAEALEQNARLMLADVDRHMSASAALPGTGPHSDGLIR